jgi:hypothetical protein
MIHLSAVQSQQPVWCFSLQGNISSNKKEKQIIKKKKFSFFAFPDFVYFILI